MDGLLKGFEGSVYLKGREIIKFNSIALHPS